jgi:hypothetical protein
MKNTFSTLLISASLAIGVAAVATPAQAKVLVPTQKVPEPSAVMGLSLILGTMVFACHRKSKNTNS